MRTGKDNKKRQQKIGTADNTYTQKIEHIKAISDKDKYAFRK